MSCDKFPSPVVRGWTVFGKSGCGECRGVVKCIPTAELHYLNCDSYLHCARESFLVHLSGLCGIDVTRFPLVFRDGKYVGGDVASVKNALRSIHRLFPIVDTASWSFYQRQRDSFWTVQEVDFSQDGTDVLLMTPVERGVLLHILGFFASSDSVVNERLVLGLFEDAPSSEARMFLTMQMCIESIHQEMYNSLLDVLVKDEAERDKLFNSIVTMPVIKAKSDWYGRMSSGASYSQRLAVQAIVEGLLFSASFAFIFYLKQLTKFRGKFQGLVLSNDFISRDEALHMQFSVMLEFMS